MSSRPLLALAIMSALLTTAPTVHAANPRTARASALPAENLLRNPSFESGVSAPWDGTALRAVQHADAPDGNWVARVSTSDGRNTIDDWPGDVTESTAGTRYTATAYLAAATASTVARTVVLVAREHAADGATVASWASQPLVLSTAFQLVQAEGTAHADGDLIDVYVYEQDPASADAYFADAFALVARAPVPVTNEVPNASFEQQRLSPWAGVHGTLSRLHTANAPDGVVAAQLTASGSGSYMSVDDWPGTTTTHAGQAYEASASIAAGSASAIGRTAQLIVREHAPDGSYVTEFDSADTPLRTGFDRLVVDGVARRSGDLLDVYVVVHAPAAGDTLLVDAVSLAPRSSTLGELAIDTGQADYLGDTSRYAYVIIQENEYAHIPAIKAANARTKVLAYLDVASVQDKSCSDPNPPAYSPHDSFAVDYCWVQDHHPEWFLTDKDGHRLAFADYRADLAVDVGAGGYRTLWAENAASAARTDGFDGVYLDDVNTHPGHGLDGAIAQYSDQGYGQAMVGFVNDVAGRLDADGLLTFANVSLDPWVGWELADTMAMAGHLSVINREFYSRWGTACGPFSDRFSDPAPYGNRPWLPLQGLQASVQVAGSHFAGLDYGDTPSSADDRATMSYGRASFLLSWDGEPGGAYLFRPCGDVDPADPAWTVDVGLPTAPPVLTHQSWMRPFTNGLVLLNPAPSASTTTPLDGTFTTPTGQLVTGSAVLPPESALILTRTDFA